MSQTPRDTRYPSVKNRCPSPTDHLGEKNTDSQIKNIIPWSGLQQLWFMVLITMVAGAYKPTYNWGGHIVAYVTWFFQFSRIGHAMVVLPCFPPNVGCWPSICRLGGQVSTPCPFAKCKRLMQRASTANMVSATWNRRIHQCGGGCTNQRDFFKQQRCRFHQQFEWIKKHPVNIGFNQRICYQ